MSDLPQDDVQPPLSPTLKRKRGDSIASINGHHTAEKIQLDDDASDISELVIDEDALDEIADQVALSQEGHSISLTLTPAEVRSRVATIGYRDFVEEVLRKNGMSAETLGMSFGLDPDMIDDEDTYLDILARVLVQFLTRRRKLPQHNTIDDAATLLKSAKHIMIITGAGISTSLGIPDFRSKHTGFYSKLLEMGFSEPEDVFDIDHFDNDPSTFYTLAGDILPAGKQFTPTHGFIRSIQDHGSLLTNYTQNIDNLEANAGIDTAKLIQCHGSFATASCRKCKYQVPGEDIFDDIRAKRVANCKKCIQRLEEDAKRPTKKHKPKQYSKFDEDDEDQDDDIPTAGVMKPDITFFGEQLPDNFFDRFTDHDCHQVDLVIVIGTSLKVAPVADIPNHLPEHVPHIYISREPCKHIQFDIQLLGDCDKVVWELSRRAGWNLQHEMILKDMSVQVDQNDVAAHYWDIAVPGQSDEPEN